MNLVNAVDDTNQQFLYRGEDAVNVFCKNLHEIRDGLKERMQENKEIEMTDEDKEAFNNTTHCFICVEELRNTYKTEKEAEKYKKVRDHCHFTGKYRGCAHSICNLNYCNKHFENPDSHVHLKLMQLKGSGCMRPVALAGVTGGLASWALQLLREVSSIPDTGPPLYDNCPICELGGSSEILGFKVDWTSVGLGIVLGLILGPVIDCLYLVRQLWTLQLRSLAAGWRPIRGGFRVVG